MTAGQSYKVTMRMRNTGSNTWTPATSYCLRSQNEADNTRWGLNRVAVPTSVASGAEVSFDFSVTAPATAGSYNFQWQMAQDGVAWFGGYTTNTVVNVNTATPTAGEVLISEFRLRGANGANDEFIELYNNSDTALTVSAADGSAGWSLVASDAGMRLTIPNNTVIPARGHYLGVNGSGYSLSNYPAGYDSSNNLKTAVGDASWPNDIADDAGIALFRTTNPANFSESYRLDAVGFVTANGLYREAGGLPPVGSMNGQYSWVRKLDSGKPQDTNDNVNDFLLVSTTGASYNGTLSVLGAPGPENLSSPINRNLTIRNSLVDPLQSASHPNNRYRVNCTTDPSVCNPTTSRLGTLSFRRTYTNISGQPVTRLRFRVTTITTKNTHGYVDCNAPGAPTSCPQADLRVLISTNITVTRTDGIIVPVRGTTLETPPGQTNGGGYNSTLTITLSTPLGTTAPDNAVSVQFLTGVQHLGSFSFFVTVEALP